MVQRQPQIADTISDQITGDIQLVDQDNEGNKLEKPYYTFTVTPQMVNEVGTISFGVLNEIVANAAKRALLQQQRRNTWIEQVNLHYLRLIQLESKIAIHTRLLELGRRSAKLEIEIYLENTLAALAIVTCQVLERP